MSRTPFSTRLLAAGLANFQETTLQLRSSHAMTIVMDDNLSVLNFDVHPIRIGIPRSEEHTSELQSLMRISYAVFCLNTNSHSRTPNRPSSTPAPKTTIIT